jgi:hypothetical protein
MTFFNCFSSRIPLSNKKNSTVDYAIDRFNDAPDRRFRCSPMFNRDI